MASGKKKSSIISTIITIILYVAVFSFLAFAVIMNITKKDNEMISVFGYCLAMVQTGSMVDGGFDVGDFVLIKETNTDKIKPNDIIVFYYYYDDPADEDVTAYPLNEGNNLTLISDEITSGEYEDFYNEAEKDLGRQTQRSAIDAGAILVFHRVMNIYVDEYGVRFFETKGDSNVSSDNFVRETFIIADYVGTSKVFSTIFSFIVSPIGLVFIILVPIAYFVIAQIIAFLKEARNYTLITKLLTRNITLKDINTQKLKLANYLSPPEKIYLYDITPKVDKADMAIILWDERIDEVLKVYNKDREEYYDYLAVNLSKKDQNKLEFFKIKADIIKSNPRVDDTEAEEKAKKIYNGEVSVNNGNK